MLNLNNKIMILSDEERKAFINLKSFEGKFESLAVRRDGSLVLLCKVKYESFGEIIEPEVCISGIESELIISVLRFLPTNTNYTFDEIINIIGQNIKFV